MICFTKLPTFQIIWRGMKGRLMSNGWKKCGRQGSWPNLKYTQPWNLPGQTE
jgi:hypothetical protein